MRYVRSAQWRKMTRGEDKWEAFCKAASAWRQRQESEDIADAHDLDYADDQPGSEDDEDALEEHATISEAGAQAIPFGFEATGELHLLMRERQMRAKLKAEQLVVGQQLEPLMWDDRDDSSEASEKYVDGSLRESMQTEDDTGGVEAEYEEVASGDEVEEDVEDDLLRMQSEELWGDRYFEKQQGARCGQHALNNLVGGPQFNASDLAEGCKQVVAEIGIGSVAERRRKNV